MRLMYNIFVEGEPQAQPRPKRGKYGNFYIPPTADEWKQTVQAAFLKERRKPRIQGRAVIEIHFFFHQSIGLNGTVIPNTKTPDPDALWKPIMDALTNIGIWHDDCRVDRSGIERFWTPGQPGAHIWIEADK